MFFFPPHDSKTSRTFQEVWFLAQFDQGFFPQKKQPTIWCCGRLPRIVSLWCCSEGECSQEPRASGSNWSPKREEPVDSPWQNPWQNNPRVNSQKDVSNCGCPAGSCDLLKMVGKLHIRVNVYSLKKGRPSIKFGMSPAANMGDAPKKEGSKKT